MEREENLGSDQKARKEMEEGNDSLNEEDKKITPKFRWEFKAGKVLGKGIRKVWRCKRGGRRILLSVSFQIKIQRIFTITLLFAGLVIVSNGNCNFQFERREK